VSPSIIEQLPLSPRSDEATGPAESMDQLNNTPPSSSNLQSDVEKWELSDEEESPNLHVPQTKKKTQSMISSFAEDIASWKQWFKMPAFYIYGFVYMACRLLVNVQSVRKNPLL